MVVSAVVNDVDNVVGAVSVVVIVLAFDAGDTLAVDDEWTTVPVLNDNDKVVGVVTVDELVPA